MKWTLNIEILLIYFVALQGDGAQVTKDNVKELLSDAEWELLIGSGPEVDYEIVRPRVQKPRRSLRQRIISISGLGRNWISAVSPSESIVSADFALLGRRDNGTENLTERHRDVLRCFYRGEDIAVSICDGIRGIVSSGEGSSYYYTIHPLPRRFRNATAIEMPLHVIARRTLPLFLRAPVQAVASLTTDDAKEPSEKKNLHGRIASSNCNGIVDRRGPKIDRDEMVPDIEVRFKTPGESSTTASPLNNLERRISLPEIVDIASNDSDPTREAFTSKGLCGNFVDAPAEISRNGSADGLLHAMANGQLPSPPAFADNDHETAANPRPARTNVARSRDPRESVVLGRMDNGQREAKEKEDSVEGSKRAKRGIASSGPIFVETAVFIDRDLYKHMARNYPRDTERELVRFVLAMINAVQLLYHDPSLGQVVNFVLKRLEILHSDPSGMHRPHDIDKYLSSFCQWQGRENPGTDQDTGHWDHALMLTGLDLYVVDKRGKVNSQVVGLAPVAGMCTKTSSCTVNEGRHFESVYVVAHEIGHNLGMRHDGGTSDNACDSTSYIMSPTLGSGKITWSPCSRNYLRSFLQTPQSRCLLDHGNSGGQLDHSAENALPGERFDSDHQCMLKYGYGSRHSTQQPLEDICRDMHCERERYTWTSHPALEGTYCGEGKWCRGGRCADRDGHSTSTGSNEKVSGVWSAWHISECASGCLSEGHVAKAGSTGIRVIMRSCTNPSPRNGGDRCRGPRKRYIACNAMQCSKIPPITVHEFADQICTRAREVDDDLLGTGLQRISSDPEEACTVWCHTKNRGAKSRGWTFPDGTKCRTRKSDLYNPSYCIAGRCEEFRCSGSDENKFIDSPERCYGLNTNDIDRMDDIALLSKNLNPERPASNWMPSSECHFNCIAPGIGIRLVSRLIRRTNETSIQLCDPDSNVSTSARLAYHVNTFRATCTVSDKRWCTINGTRGMECVDTRHSYFHLANVDVFQSCEKLKSPYQFATNICGRYKRRVRRLSGLGMQISPTIEDPDRPCRVACQDESVYHRFYLVNGENGWFPFGTACSKGNRKAFCVTGKCLEFGKDDSPLYESALALPLLSRYKRTLVTETEERSGFQFSTAPIKRGPISRKRRNFEFEKTTVRSHLNQRDLDNIIWQLNFSGSYRSDLRPLQVVDLTNPIYVPLEEFGYGYR